MQKQKKDSKLTNIQQSKTAIITLMLTLTIAITLVSLPIVSSQTATQELVTYVYVSAPQRTGVNQVTLINWWTDELPPIGMGEEHATRGWKGVYVELTSPEGTTETIMQEVSDPVGGGYFMYTPTQLGTYEVKAFFPGQWKNTTRTNTFYTSAESAIATFVVQEEPIETFGETPLPDDYWTRPIGGASQNWNELTGNWMSGNANVFPQGGAGGVTTNYGYGTAPESAHILWTRQFYPAGIMDERFGTDVYTTGYYEGLWFGAAVSNEPVILNGIIHYSPQYTAHMRSGWAGIDLYTGEELFLDYEEQPPEFGQIYFYDTPNQHGGFAYLWRTSDVTLPEGYTSREGTETWEMIDAYTNNRVCYVANVSAAGTGVYGKDGSILRYNTVNYGTSENPDYHLTVWNSSAITTMLAYPPEVGGTGAWSWRPMGVGGGGGVSANYIGGLDKNRVQDGDTGFSLNMSIQSILGPRNSVENQTGIILAVREGEYIIIGTPGKNDDGGVVPTWLMAFSLEPGKEGDLLWETQFTRPYAPKLSTGRVYKQHVSMTGVYPEDEVVLFQSEQVLKRWAYDMKTGELLWESDTEENMNFYGMLSNVYEGKLLAHGRYGGTLIAYDIRTGEIEWTYNTESLANEAPYGHYPILDFTVGDGKVYIISGEHSRQSPMWRGPNLRCVDLETGNELWSTLFWGSSQYDNQAFLSDGILVGLNFYDGQLYAFGKGPSATTVTATPKTAESGNSIMIEGTVTDQTSTGRRNINNELDFTLEGTPAIADEYMSEWMEYLFMQQKKPEDATGVPVKLSTIDPNGNYQEIGETTSDSNGNFGVSWVPPVPGEYQITAEFAGSESYGASSATTYFVVAEAPAVTQPIEPETETPDTEAPDTQTPDTEAPDTETPATEAPLITTEIAIIAAVAVACVIGVAAFFALRKRK